MNKKFLVTKNIFICLFVAAFLTSCSNYVPERKSESLPKDSEKLTDSNDDVISSDTENDMSIKENDGSTDFIVDDTYYHSYIVTGKEENVKTYGAKGDGETDDTQAVKSALNTAKNKRSTVYFPKGIYKLTENISFPSSCILAFQEGATILSDKMVRITTVVKAGNYHILGGQGKYKCNFKNSYCNPVWFGAKGDGKTDDTKAFANAIESSASIYIPYSNKGFVVGDLKLNKSVKIVGISAGNGKRTRLIGKHGSSNIFSLNVNSIVMDNFDIDMSDSGKATVFYYDTSLQGRDDYQIRNMDIVGGVQGNQRCCSYQQLCYEFNC